MCWNKRVARESMWPNFDWHLSNFQLSWNPILFEDRPIQSQVLPMSPTMMSLLAGMAGAVIGASASIITVIVQAKIQDRRERHKHMLDLAIEDYKLQLDLTKQAGGPREIPPIFLFVDYHLRLAKLIESDNLTPASYSQACKENSDFYAIIKQINEQRNRSST